MPTSASTLIDALLEDQQSLTAVERFARQHSTHALSPAERYRELLPATPPAAGEQYAFEVDLDKCSGCKACVTACHSLNGLDDTEAWREVGLLVTRPKRYARPAAPAFTQHVTTACHHCVDPACLNGCPVLAYDKDPITGIVRHLDDQCIGCQYCVLKCPYDVPKYNERLGIVRKCDMCTNRLAADEPPACAQACPNEAIRIRTVSVAAVTIEFRQRGATFLPATPSGEYTVPTTKYISRQNGGEQLPVLVAADADAERVQQTHWPLVLMLVFSQASVGAVGAAIFALKPIYPLVIGLALAFASSAASVFHLGRPMGAWRFFLGLRQSWLSREILAFSVYIPVLVFAVVFRIGLPAALLAGIAAVGCSVMIYHDTQRTLWRAKRSGVLFYGTTACFGAGVTVLSVQSSGWAIATLIVAAAVKIGVELSIARHITDREQNPLRRSASLLLTRFSHWAMVRVACLVGGAGTLASVPLLGFTRSEGIGFSSIALVLLLCGEVIERALFFKCVHAPKMPGGFQ